MNLENMVLRETSQTQGNKCCRGLLSGTASSGKFRDMGKGRHCLTGAEFLLGVMNVFQSYM